MRSRRREYRKTSSPALRLLFPVSPFPPCLRVTFRSGSLPVEHAINGIFDAMFIGLGQVLQVFSVGHGNVGAGDAQDRRIADNRTPTAESRPRTARPRRSTASPPRRSPPDSSSSRNSRWFRYRGGAACAGRLISASMPSLASSAAASSATSTIFECAIMVTSRPGPFDVGHPQRDQVLPVGNLAARAVQDFRLNKNHRVVVANGGLQQVPWRRAGSRG